MVSLSRRRGACCHSLQVPLRLDLGQTDGLLRKLGAGVSGIAVDVTEDCERETGKIRPENGGKYKSRDLP